MEKFLSDHKSNRTGCRSLCGRGYDAVAASGDHRLIRQLTRDMFVRWKVVLKDGGESRLLETKAG